MLLVILSVVVLGASGIYLDANNSWLANPKAAAQGQTQSVTIQNFAFSPASITVTPGTTVTWTNKDPTAHTVTADSGSGPMSGQVQSGQTYSFKFSQAGTFAYHCSIHPQMKATVVVSSSSTTAPSTTGQQQQQTQSTPSMGGMGAGTTPSPQPAAPSETGGQGGQVATGPVETGGGALAANRLQNELIALVIGGLSLVAATMLLVTRLVTRRVLSRNR